MCRDAGIRQSSITCSPTEQGQHYSPLANIIDGDEIITNWPMFLPSATTVLHRDFDFDLI